MNSIFCLTMFHFSPMAASNDTLEDISAALNKATNELNENEKLVISLRSTLQMVGKHTNAL